MPVWILTGDSCISQLLSIVHDINSSYDCHPMINVRGVFLDISKAFDKVWHDGILLKLETYSVEGKLLNFKVVLNGQTSTWELVKSGVPQESVIGPLMFLLYIMINDLQDKWFTIINDLQDNIRSTCKTFADDTLFFPMFLIRHLARRWTDVWFAICKWLGFLVENAIQPWPQKSDFFQSWVCNFIEKDTLVQVFSCELCEISKNTFFNTSERLLLLPDLILIMLILSR